MFKKTTLDFKSAGTLNKLVLDYLEKNQKLKPFYGFFPDKRGFSELLKTNPYAGFNREALAGTLLRQSQLVENASESSVAGIEKLKSKNTFTVTTGHQLCLFTGPLYFIYKIFSAITLAETLKKEFPAYDFVPVYWMASEDHDFEEISSFNVNGKTITWNSDQKGAVGDFKTTELLKIIPALKDALGISTNSKYLTGLFENAYLKHQSLADATRYLVNELFGQYGLVTIDGNDKAFKSQVRELFRQDIFNHSISAAVEKSIKALEELDYNAQVNPRSINCFYLENNLRARIEASGELFNLVGTDKSFTKKELEEIIHSHPEKISPNVVLRPVYQQIILPNIAYIGGPGELAYWLEFKAMFDELKVIFPVLMPRDFISVVDKPTQNKIEKLHFTAADFFKPEQEVIKEHLVKINAVFSLDEEAEKIAGIYTDILSRTSAFDKTLERHVAAAGKKTANLINTISAKSNRALKRKSEASIRQIENTRQQLFPGGTPQERYENFASLYLKYGPDFFEQVKNNTAPFLQAQKILIEE